jgi:membrane protease YdiL (CAAX protease family)
VDAPTYDPETSPAVPLEAASPPPPPPRKSGVAFVAIVLALYAVLGTLAQAASPVPGLLWSEGFALLLPAFVAASGSNLRPAHALLLTRRPGATAMGLAVLVGAAGFFAAGALMGLTSLALPARWLEIFDMSKIFARPPLERAALAAVAATVAPFCEEIAFRGWLLTALRTRHRAGVAVGLSGLLFAVMHLDPVRFSALLGLGVLYAWLAFRSGSVWPSILAHAVNNGLGVALATRGGTSLAAARAEPRAEIAIAAAITLGCAAAALQFLIAAYRRATPAPPAVGDALLRRDVSDRSTAFRFGRVPIGQLVAIAAGLVSLAALLLVGVAGRR